MNAPVDSRQRPRQARRLADNIWIDTSDLLRDIMLRNCTHLVIGGSLFLSACTKPEPEPNIPPPVTVTTPAEQPGDATPASATEASAIQGKWSHTLPGPDGKDHTVVLEYVRDQDGHERFEFVQQHWTSKPLFEEQITSGDQTELRFKIITNPDEPEDNPRTLRYVLTRDNEMWIGKLFESWTESPYDVVLTRSE